MRRALLVAAAALAILVPAPGARAGDGDLDAGFGNQGVVEVGAGGMHTAIQPDGRILVAFGLPREETVYVARLTPTGAIDQTFGDEGYAKLRPGGGMYVGPIAVGPDGEIVATGVVSPRNSWDTTVVRLTPDGRKDSSFGVDGAMRFEFDTGLGPVPAGVVVQADRRIVVIGAGRNDFAAVRIDPTGALDTTFSGDGRVYEDLGGSELVADVLLQRDRLVLVGTSHVPEGSGSSTTRVGAVALMQDGSRDTSYGARGDGAVVSDPGVPAQARRATVAPDGGILITGSAQRAPRSSEVGLLKLDPSGLPDPGFGDGGWQFTNLGAESVFDAYVTATVDGKFAVAYNSGTVTGPRRFVIAKFTHAGALDPSFGDGGHRTYADDAFAREILRQPDGRLVASAVTPNNQPTVRRIEDSLPVLAALGGAGAEGAAIPFAAILNKTSGVPVTADYTTADGSAGGRDYVGGSGALTIPPGQLAAPLAFPALADRLLEPDEDVRLELSNPAGARLGESVGTGTIVNALRTGRCANVLAGAGVLRGSNAGDRITGAPGPDRITGRGGDDCIVGGSGNDRLAGDSGNDRIDGGGGRNAYYGGPGRDKIHARNGRSEVVKCGSGRDRVQADRSDRLRDCERVTR